MLSRHKHFFSGEDAHYAEIENIFLTMEGAANWAAYRTALAEGASEAVALKLIRRKGNKWAQDEGLALFLVIDSLLPNWQKRTFGKSLVSVMNLLNEAVHRK